MKKTYVSPVAKTYKANLRTDMMIGSNDGLTDAGTNIGKEGSNDTDFAKTIWDDETADGFNW